MSQREKILVLICVVVVLALGLPMLLGAIAGGGSNGTTISEVRRQAAEARKQSQRLRIEMAGLQPQVQRLAWSEPPDVVFPQVARTIAELGRKGRVTIPSIRSMKSRPLDVLTEVPVEVNVSADFPSLVRFLYMLQDPQVRLSLDRVRITGTDPETDRVSVELGASTYTTYMEPVTTTRATGRASGAGAAAGAGG